MHVVLVDPQIPQNTGSIARTCAATQSPLHIVGTPAFEINEKNVRRAGLDYWPHVNLTEHKTWEDFIEQVKPNNVWLFSKFASKVYHTANYHENDALVFGSETKGLGKEFISSFPEEQALLIPMECEEVRSLNLSNSVSIALYDALRQIGKV